MRVPRSRTFSAFVLLVMGVAVSAFVVAPTAAASDPVPFAAAMTGSVTSTAPCGVLTVCSAVKDEGTATHLGLVTFTKTVTIHITFAPCDGGGILTTYTETGTLTAANGDTLTVSGSGHRVRGERARNRRRRVDRYGRHRPILRRTRQPGGKLRPQPRHRH